MNLAARLKNPLNKYRPIPFWSWNERLTVDETRRQIAEMDKAGIGGYFMHARGGLQTPYLGEEWMDNIAAGIDEARKRDMGAWVYDENGWPSGFGDGRVNGLGIEYQQKYLRMDPVGADPGVRPEDEDRTITVVAGSDGQRLRFHYEVNPFYVDTLDAHVVKTFIETILDEYAARFPDDLGKALPGVFTDEPQVSRNGIPWSFTLPGKYREAYDEELLPLLPQLFSPVDLPTGEGEAPAEPCGSTPSAVTAARREPRPPVSYKRTRYRFWHLVQELFVTSFTQQMYDWCERHGAQLTGHMVLEETLLSQLTSNAAVMPHYEFFHVPGMDWLGRHIDPPTTPLQVASVAHQLGRKQILSETFALCGWNVSWEELKWLFEWQAVRGVTQLCQHLEGYSLRGIRKRDYPPSLFYQQPWWDKYRAFNDYVSRLGMLLAEGEVQFDVLVIHPQSSAWLAFDNGKNDGIHELFQPFLDVTKTLEGAHVPFHYGDERILARHGEVELRGTGFRTCDRGASFPACGLRVGNQLYFAVIVPPCETLARSTVELLQQYADAGGALVWVGGKPTLVEGEPSAELPALAQRGESVPDCTVLETCLPKQAYRLSVIDDHGAEIERIAATHRHFADYDGRGPADFYFLANADNASGYEVVVRLLGKSAERLVLETGATEPLPFTREVNEVAIRHTFAPMDSLALLVYADDRALPVAMPALVAVPAKGTEFLDLASKATPASVAVPAECTDSLDSASKATSLDGEWELQLLDPNALTLDYCDFWIDRKLIAENEHISVVQGRCLEYGRPVDLRLRFPVRAAWDFDPDGELYLVLERPDDFQIMVNGAPLTAHDAGHYRDTSFRKLSVKGLLRPGRNEILLETRFAQSPAVYEQLERAKVFEAEKNKLTFNSEIEAVYLIGDFGVVTPEPFEQLPRHALRCPGDFLLTRAPSSIPLADLVQHGLPFFNGTVRLTRTVTLAADEIHGRRFRFADMRAHVASLSVNGTSVKEWFWRPFEANLDGLLQPGENEFVLELTNGLRNLLGPHHLEEGESYAVAPPSFYKEPSVFGCAGQWNEGYCFVEFGVEGTQIA